MSKFNLIQNQKIIKQTRPKKKNNKTVPQFIAYKVPTFFAETNFP